MENNLLNDYLDENSLNIYNRANRKCNRLLKDSQKIINNYFKENNINNCKICFIAVGSVGRSEALDASDLDILPVVVNDKSMESYKNYDKELRSIIENKLSIKVSEGKKLTKLTKLNDLICAKNIGGKRDSNSELTKRILILTEGREVCGNLNIYEIKRKLINSYQEHTITSGRFILTFCNDLARYYRTLCIDYKAKIDVEGKDWCTRNIKLRCTRKLWYFSNILTLVSLAYESNLEKDDYIDNLIKYFNLPPYIRLFKCLNENQYILGKQLLKCYALYLDFMSKEDNRLKLSKIKHEKRYHECDTNPFPFLKINSDMMHSSILQLIDSLNYKEKQKLLDWFLL